MGGAETAVDGYWWCFNCGGSNGPLNDYCVDPGCDGVRSESLPRLEIGEVRREAARDVEAVAARERGYSIVDVEIGSYLRPDAEEAASNHAFGDTTISHTWGDTYGTISERHEDDETDKISITSTSRDSTFSVGSFETLATDFSKAGGFSTAQILSATEVFVSILREDKGLLPLYDSARNNPRIGAKRLRRKLREIIKTFANNLEGEAKDHLEFSASRLVRFKAHHAARCIASMEFTGKQDKNSATKQGRETRIADESSDDEGQQPPVNESEFGDIHAFRLFLTESNAYATLHAEVGAFRSPEPGLPMVNNAITGTDPAVFSKIPNTRNWHVWHDDANRLMEGIFQGWGTMLMFTTAVFLVIDAIFMLTDKLFIAARYLEHPLERDRIRMRCKCECGEQFFDDYVEQNEGGMGALAEQIIRAMGTKTTVSSYSSQGLTQRYTFQFPRWLQDAYRKATYGFEWQYQSTTLPKHSTGTATSSSTIQNAGAPQQDTLHLMSSVHRNLDHIVLLQDSLETIKTDRALFSFLKKRLSRRRNPLSRVLSCRSIEGIFFTKFLLQVCGSVEVRPHSPHCISLPTSTCTCLPPVSKIGTEYHCTRPSPSDTWPIVGPRTLVHMLKCPGRIDEKQTWILSRVPKRTQGKLEGGADVPTEGWGLYFEEAWDVDMILGIIIVMILLGSLLFGICWTVLEHDIQGAFGVSGYMITAGGVLIAVIVRQTGKMG